MNVEKVNLAVAEDMMIAFWNLYAELQIEGHANKDMAWNEYRRWTTVFNTLGGNN